MHFDFFLPTQIIFGRGRLQELSELPMPGRKALIVITNGRSMRNLGYLDRVIGLLAAQGVDAEIFDKVLPNPIEKHVMEAAEFARNSNCDFVIGLGGGSAIDSAKAIAVMVRNPGTYWDYVKENKDITEEVLPIIAIPTTAGTGTEADPWTVITNTETNEKIGYGIPETFPALAIVDPALMTSVPKKLTAYQGMDAFFSCRRRIFGLCSPAYKRFTGFGSYPPDNQIFTSGRRRRKQLAGQGTNGLGQYRSRYN